MKAISKIYNYIRCIPKTIYFNLRYFPIQKALLFPVLVSHRTKLQSCRGCITLPQNASFGKIKIGFGSVQVADNSKSRTIWNVEKDGIIHFGYNNKIGTGCKIHVKGEFILQNNVNFTGESTIICFKSISIGSNILISWQNLFMDTDFHPIYNNKNEQLNHDKNIVIGDNVWIGARCTVLKGSEIGSNSVIAAASVITSKFDADSIIGGKTAQIIGSMKNKHFTD